MDNKVYYPEVIQDNPFPGEAPIIDSLSQPSAGGNHTPTVTNDKLIARKKIAQELLSTALNTRSKKILQEFQLAQSGGIQIGDFKEGISGDIRLTPNGITARDIAGLTTFALDGTDGSATFKGEVQAADFTVIDEQGLISLSSFQFDSLTLPLNQSVTAVLASPDDVTGATFTITPDRSVNVLFLVQTRAFIDTQTVGDFQGNGIVALKIDGESIVSGDTLVIGGKDVGGDSSNIEIASYSIHRIRQLSAGEHICKLISWIDQLGVGNARLNITSVVFSYLQLGR